MSAERRTLGVLLILLVSAFWSWISLQNPREDFIYLYAGSSLYARGQNPYDPLTFQNALSSFLGRRNPYPSRFYAAALPPWDFTLLQFLPRFSYKTAFYLWSFIIFLSLAFAIYASLYLAEFSLGELRSYLAIFFIASFPGLIHGVFYHRLAVVVFAAFVLGLILWQKGYETLATFAWGFLSLLPQWFLCVFLFLLMNRKWRAAALSLWPMALGIFSILIGNASWVLWQDFALSLFHYGSRFVFFDDQSLVVQIYKSLHFFSFLKAASFASLFEPSPWLQFFRKIGGVFSGFFILWISLRPGSAQKRLALIFSIALLGSLYSHCGDQVWILPLFLAVLRDIGNRKISLWFLLILISVNLLLIPNYRALPSYFWFWSGYWSVGYLTVLGVFWIWNTRNLSSGPELKA